MDTESNIPKSRSAPRMTARGRLAISVSAAVLTVAGTATIAWAALGLALSPVSESHVPATPDLARTTGEGTAFAAHTLAMISASPAVVRQAPVRVAAAQAPRLDPRSDLAAAIAAPVAPALPVAALPLVADPARTRPVARPDPAVLTRQAAAQVRVAATPVRSPVSATPVARNRPEEDRGTRLKKIWSVGAFR